MVAFQHPRQVRVARLTLALVALAVVIAAFAHKQVLSAVCATKLLTWLYIAKEVLSYVGLVLQGELNLRLAGFTATSCHYATSWLKWPHHNWVVILLQSGLLLRAGRLTWNVYMKTRQQLSFTPRELRLYKDQFEPHGLTKMEYHELLRAGAEWKSWAPCQTGTGQKAVHRLTEEGEPVQNFLLLTSGSCSVQVDGEEVALIGKGAIVGEGSFARKKAGQAAPNAMATVAAAGGPIEYVAWSVKELEHHMSNDSRVKACLMTLIAHSLADKLDTTTHVLSKRLSVN